jgi:hypothetical protein
MNLHQLIRDFCINSRQNKGLKGSLIYNPAFKFASMTKHFLPYSLPLMEELETIDWYNQRIDAYQDDELSAILAYHIRWRAQPLRVHQNLHQWRSYRIVYSFIRFMWKLLN